MVRHIGCVLSYLVAQVHSLRNFRSAITEVAHNVCMIVVPVV